MRESSPIKYARGEKNPENPIIPQILIPTKSTALWIPPFAGMTG